MQETSTQDDRHAVGVGFGTDGDTENEAQLTNANAVLHTWSIEDLAQPLSWLASVRGCLCAEPAVDSQVHVTTSPAADADDADHSNPRLVGFRVAELELLPNRIGV